MSNMAGPENWPRHRKKIRYFEWSPPWHYFGLVSDISCGSIYSIYFLAFYSGILSDILFWHSVLTFYSGILSGIIRTSYSASFLASVLTFSLAFYQAVFLKIYLTSILTFFPASILAFYLTFYSWGPAVPTEIWCLQCPLRSGACGWGPAVPTAHWDLELAVEGRRWRRSK